MTPRDMEPRARPEERSRLSRLHRGLEQVPWLYDALFRLMEAFGLRRWWVWLVKGARGRTLDVGCGTGRNLPLYGEGMEVVGLDPDPLVLRRARSRAPSTPLVRGSAEALPFRPGVFDTVVSGFVFWSVPNAVKGLTEVKRVLRPDGSLRMLEHVRATWPLRRWWQNFVQPAWVCLLGGCHSNRDTESNVRLAGYRVDERVCFDNFRKLIARPLSGSDPREADGGK